GTRWALGGAAVLLALALGLVVVGLPARLIWPGHWGELSDDVGRSLRGLTDVPIPYAGADAWTRLVILLAAPLTVGVAAFAAFWPWRRRAAGRISALVLLVGLYLVAVSWARPGRQLAGGALLVILVCAWLWLPALQRGRGTAAGIAVAAAALVAVPAAALVDPGKALIDYRHWNLLSAHGISFRWDQFYGPLDWPQKGTLLMEVSSEKSHYWKATNLDTFDGVRWLRASGSSVEPPLGEPLKYHPKGTDPSPDSEWVDRINFQVRGLTSDFAIGAGTTLALRDAEATPDPDGTWLMSHELHPGETYTALVYDPKPSAAEMRAAGTAYAPELRRYTAFTLTGGPDGALTIDPPFWGANGPTPINAEARDTPYEHMYALAHRLAAGAATPYDAVHRIEVYLRANFAYQQDVPNRTYPLPSFLSDDHAGYCQQFSGTMALMLRMLGIPSRVAVGFAPGARDPDHNNYLVDDTDAHNWVEAFFPNIGWATFEPTPPTSPAAAQLDDNALGVTDPALPSDPGSADQSSTDPRGADAPKSTAQKGGPTALGGSSSGPGFLVVLGLGAGVVALLAVGGYGVRVRRRGRLSPDELADGELRELERAIARLDQPLPPGSTLQVAQRELMIFAGPAAARYAAGLEAHRYRDPDSAPPGVAERRELRRALISAAAPSSALAGPGTVLRVLRALPPGGPAIRRRARGSRTTSRPAHPPSADATAAPG
ncbi:MAG TPA: transglutaminase-like domain-containing protein, partial [Candidatus Dormibacteraeota bacterium]